MRGASPRADRPATLHRIASLDGLRAISIVLVMGLHTLQRMRSTSVVWAVVWNGAVGVSVFFVLSGYLITRLLLHEHGVRGRVSLGGFYAKRAFRIVPPVYGYVAVLGVLAAAGRLRLSGLDVWSALLFFRDYVTGTTHWMVEHLWTLGVEEQFYLVWPVVLVWCLRARDESKGRRRAAWVTGVVIALSPVVRVLCYRVRSPLLHHGLGFHMNADLLMFGSATALLEGRRGLERVYGALTRLPWVPFAGIAVCSYLEVRYQNYWRFPVGDTVLGVLLCAVLLWCVRHAEGRVGRVLNHPVVVHVGLISYSLYVWQTLFLNDHNGEVFHGGWAWVARLPVSWAVTVAVAEVSYFLVERPALRVRQAVLRAVTAERRAAAASGLQSVAE